MEAVARCIAEHVSLPKAPFMILRLVAAALSLVVLATVPAAADDDGWRRQKHRDHHRDWHDRPHYWQGARVVIWQPAPVYRAYPAYRPYPVYPAYPAYPPYAVPAPVYVPAPVVAQAPAVQAAPMRDFQDPSGRYCREYQRIAVINGQQQQIYGTACMMPDGSWQIVSE